MLFHFSEDDSPRIVCRKDEATTDEHLQLFFNNSIANTIVTVESDWYTRISKQIIFRYRFDEEGFELLIKQLATTFLAK